MKKHRWFYLLGIWFLLVALSVLAQQQPPLDPSSPVLDLWTKLGTLLNGMGSVLGAIALWYAIRVNIRTQKAYSALFENIRALNEEIRANTQEIKVLHQRSEALQYGLNTLHENIKATSEDMQRMREESRKSDAALYAEMQRMFEENRKSDEAFLQRLLSGNEEIKTRIALSEATQNLTGKWSDLYISACKRDAQHLGYLNLVTIPPRHYEINQRGIDVLNALNPELQEKIADVKTEGMPANELLLSLDLPMLSALVRRYSQQRQEELTVDVVLGVIAVCAGY
jgi:hypothetical protein